jgi:hypothetical protein
MTPIECQAATLCCCSGLPQIQDFINKLAPSIKNLKVSMKEYAYPRLVLFKAKNERGVSETVSVRVDNWKAAEIAEYLADKLVTPDVAPAATTS